MSFASGLVMTCTILTQLTIDRLTVHGPRVFASANGVFGLKVVPDPTSTLTQMAAALQSGQPTRDIGMKTKVVLFRVNFDGSDEIQWSSDLSYMPCSAWVAASGQVITLNSESRPGREHALVVYSNRGETIGDHALPDLLSAEEIEHHAPKLKGGTRKWTGEYKILPRRDAARHHDSAVLELEWGKQIVVDLETGELLRR